MRRLMQLAYDAGPIIAVLGAIAYAAWVVFDHPPAPWSWQH